MSKIDRQIVYKKYNGHCAYCGYEIKYKDMQVDHIHPKARSHQKIFDINFKLEGYENLNPACRVCNIKKNSMSLEQFRESIIDDIRMLKQYSVKFRFALRYNLIQETSHTIIFYFEQIKLQKL